MYMYVYIYGGNMQAIWKALDRDSKGHLVLEDLCKKTHALVVMYIYIYIYALVYIYIYIYIYCPRCYVFVCPRCYVLVVIYLYALEDLCKKTHALVDEFRAKFEASVLVIALLLVLILRCVIVIVVVIVIVSNSNSTSI